jgi:hypothetical protein
MHPIGAHASDVEQQGCTFYVSINDVLNTLQAADKGCDPLLAGQLECR